MAAGQQGGTTVPIPMSAVSLGISVSVPQQKAIAGRISSLSVVFRQVLIQTIFDTPKAMIALNIIYT